MLENTTCDEEHYFSLSYSRKYKAFVMCRVSDHYVKMRILFSDIRTLISHLWCYIDWISLYGRAWSM